MGEENQQKKPRRTREDRQATRENRKQTARNNRDKRRAERNRSALDRNQPFNGNNRQQGGFDQNLAGEQQVRMFRELRDAGMANSPIADSSRNRGNYNNNPLGSPPPGQPYLRSERDRLMRIQENHIAKAFENNMNAPASVILPREIVMQNNPEAGPAGAEMRYHPAIAQKILERGMRQEIPHPFAGKQNPDQHLQDWTRTSQQIVDNPDLYQDKSRVQNAQTRLNQYDAYNRRNAPMSVQLPDGKGSWRDVTNNPDQAIAQQQGGGSLGVPTAPVATPVAASAGPSNPGAQLYQQMLDAQVKGSQMPGLGYVNGVDESMKVAGLQGMWPQVRGSFDMLGQQTRDWFNRTVLGQDTNHVQEAIARIVQEKLDQQKQQTQFPNPFSK